jgi:hypothetical protein
MKSGCFLENDEIIIKTYGKKHLTAKGNKNINARNYVNYVFIKKGG